MRSFKTLLSAPDLERALNTSATHSIDPHRAFRLRDLIVLYLAFLARGIDHAVAADPALASANGRYNRRYASPAWRGGGAGNLHAVVTQLFGEAQAVQARLGDALFSPEGVAMWVDEKRDYDKLNSDKLDSVKPFVIGDENGKLDEQQQPIVIGHYTQIIWHSTKHVGAASWTCRTTDTGTKDADKNELEFVIILGNSASTDARALQREYLELLKDR